MYLCFCVEVTHIHIKLGKLPIQNATYLATLWHVFTDALFEKQTVIAASLKTSYIN